MFRPPRGQLRRPTAAAGGAAADAASDGPSRPSHAARSSCRTPPPPTSAPAAMTARSYTGQPGYSTLPDTMNRQDTRQDTRQDRTPDTGESGREKKPNSIFLKKMHWAVRR